MANKVKGKNFVLSMEVAGTFLPFACATDCRFTVDKEVLELTTISSGQWREFAIGRKQADCNVQGLTILQDSQLVPPLDTIQSAFADTAVQMKIVLIDAGAVQRTIEFKGILPRTTLNGPASGFSDYDLDIKVTGAVTINGMVVLPSELTPLSAPTLALNEIAPGLVEATWSAITGAGGYTAQRATDPLFTQGFTVTYTGTGTSDQDSVAPGTYYYRVMANGNGTTTANSGWSNTATITIAGAAPATQLSPGTLTWQPASNTDIILSWDSDSNATGYVLEVAENGAFAGSVEIYRGLMLSFQYPQSGPITRHYRKKKLGDGVQYTDSDWVGVTVTTAEPPFTYTQTLVAKKESRTFGGFKYTDALGYGIDARARLTGTTLIRLTPPARIVLAAFTCRLVYANGQTALEMTVSNSYIGQKVQIVFPDGFSPVVTLGPAVIQF